MDGRLASRNVTVGWRLGVPVARIQDAVLEVFDLRPAVIVKALDLLRPIYTQTAAYGHFGREEPDFSWERTDRMDELPRTACGRASPAAPRAAADTAGPRLAAAGGHK